MTALSDELTRFQDFLARCRATVYREPPGDFHARLTQQMWDWLRSTVPDLPPGGSILDVGCGDGFALRMFQEDGYKPVGITVSLEDAHACRTAGLSVMLRDMHQLWGLGPFDLIWARHVLEHSPMPFYVLCQFHEILNPGGVLYIEVPAPDTACHHELNPNHYSVLGLNMWRSLLARAGFRPIEEKRMPFKAPVGPDEYFAWACRRHDKP